MRDSAPGNIVHLTASIVSSYVSNNALPLAEIPSLMTAVHSVIARLSGAPAPSAPEEARKPVVPIKKSVFDHYIICLEDGRKFKSLKRHLRTRYNMTPEQYRAKWQLPPEYPMVAPGYAEIRSRMAKDMGLGHARTGSRQKERST